MTDLTPTQADALRILVGQPHGLKLGRGTDANVGTINARVAKALDGHGLALIRDYDGAGEPCDPFALTTPDGRAWVTDSTGPEDSPEDDDALDTDESPEEVIQDQGAAEAGEHDAAPSAPIRLFEGVRIIDDLIKVTSAKVSGGADLRHGDEAVVVLVVHVDDVQHPGDEAGVTRTVVAKPARGYLADIELGEDLVRALARQHQARVSGGATLFEEDGSDDDLRDIAERLNRDELEARDEDGRRDWTEADEARAQEVRNAITDGDWHPARQFGRDAIRRLWQAHQVEVEPDWWVSGGDPGMEPEQAAEVIPHVRLTAPPSTEPTVDPSTSEAVDELLAEAEAARPQIVVVERGGAWHIDVPDGHDPIPGTWWLHDAARQAAEQTHGPLEWRQDGTRWIADLVEVTDV